MKKINLILTASLFIGLTMFSSCEKNKIVPNQSLSSTNVNDSDVSQKIAEGHNDLLQSYYNETTTSIKDYTNLDNYLTENVSMLNSLLDNEKYGKSLTKEDVSNQNRILKNLLSSSKQLSNKNNNNFDPLGYINGDSYDVYSVKVIDELLAANEISIELSNDLKNVCELGCSYNKSVYSREYVRNYVNTTFKHKKYSLKSDKKYQKTFVSVFNHSYAYWTHNPHGPNGPILVKDGSGVILADAVGALYGLLLGSVGSIIYGAAFSIIANES